MQRGLGAPCARLLTAGLLLLAGTAHVQAADDVKTCINESGDAAIEACSRAIKTRHLSGHALGRLYLSRGVEQRVKGDNDAALADFAEALKADKKYATAFFDRCAIYNFKKEYDLAIIECSQAIKLGPTAESTVGSERLGKDRALSDYYSERGYAYFRKDDNVHAMVDLDSAIRLNPENGRALKTRGMIYEAKGDSRAQADLTAAKLLGE